MLSKENAYFLELKRIGHEYEEARAERKARSACRGKHSDVFGKALISEKLACKEGEHYRLKRKRD